MEIDKNSDTRGIIYFTVLILLCPCCFFALFVSFFAASYFAETGFNIMLFTCLSISISIAFIYGYMLAELKKAKNKSIKILFLIFALILFIVSLLSLFFSSVICVFAYNHFVFLPWLNS